MAAGPEPVLIPVRDAVELRRAIRAALDPRGPFAFAPRPFVLQLAPGLLPPRGG